MSAQERLDTIAADLREGRPAPTVTVRDFLSWFGALRRGFLIVEGVRQALMGAGLQTNPDAYIDSPIELILAPAIAQDARLQPQIVETAGTVAASATIAGIGSLISVSPAYADPTYRISISCRDSRASGNPLVLEPNLDPRLRGDDANFAQAVTYFGNPQ